jgi:2,3-dimethylmalate lyase
MARTDVLGVLGIDEAIEWGNRYSQAGADLIFVEAPTSREDMIKINREIGALTMAIQIEGGKTPLMTAKELREAGYNVVVYPLSALYAAAWAVKVLLEELKEEGTTRVSAERMIAFSDFNRFIGLSEIREKEAHYYGGK